MRYCRAPYGARGLKRLLVLPSPTSCWSRPVRGAWIETEEVKVRCRETGQSRPVRGAWIETCGPRCRCPLVVVSRPVRGAWIETQTTAAYRLQPGRRAPYGARGLKRWLMLEVRPVGVRRAPYGARGLKRFWAANDRRPRWSRPVRGAWIETPIFTPLSG